MWEFFLSRGPLPIPYIKAFYLKLNLCLQIFREVLRVQTQPRQGSVTNWSYLQKIVEQVSNPGETCANPINWRGEHTMGLDNLGFLPALIKLERCTFLSRPFSPNFAAGSEQSLSLTTAKPTVMTIIKHLPMHLDAGC